MRARTRIKICCIASADEAALALDAGADALGLVSAMPSGPGVIDEAAIARVVAWLAAQLPARADSFLLTALRDAATLAAQHARCPTHTLQLVDRLPAGERARLRQALPGVRLVQVVHVEDDSAVAEALAAAADVDALLLDSGSRRGAVVELGGTGRTHDWSISARVRAAAPCPVWLAGGLNPQNVGEAIRAVRPYGIDLCNGVRTEGRLDAAKLRGLVRAVRMADAELHAV